MWRIFLFLFLAVLSVSCDQKAKNKPVNHDFIELFPGRFSSKKQAQEESGYSAISLVNKPIWKDRPGHWFYQELYDEKNDASIYYQRIINIQIEDSLHIISSSYAVPNKKKYSHGWKNTAIFNQLTIDSLSARDGCNVVFKKKTSTIYQGKTKKRTCLSSFSKKISYTTSNIVITKNKITSWDRGYDTNGKQVWGKIKGPYKFIRIKENLN